MKRILALTLALAIFALTGGALAEVFTPAPYLRDVHCSA